MCESQVEHHGEDASSLWKAGLCQTRFIYVGRCSESWLYKSYFLFFFPQGKQKKMLVLFCTQREQNKREQRKWREGATGSGKGRLGPDEQRDQMRVCGKCSCTQSPLLKEPEEGPY